MFCGPEDAVGTLLGVLKHILASHARACRAKTRETIEARQQGHLPAISVPMQVARFPCCEWNGKEKMTHAQYELCLLYL